MELTDAQWEIIAGLLPKGKSGPGRKGRPRRNNREVFEGILWILRTGARWKDLPSEFPSYQTCHTQNFPKSRRRGPLRSLGFLMR